MVYYSAFLRVKKNQICYNYAKKNKTVLMYRLKCKKIVKLIL